MDVTVRTKKSFFVRITKLHFTNTFLNKLECKQFGYIFQRFRLVLSKCFAMTFLQHGSFQ